MLSLFDILDHILGAQPGPSNRHAHRPSDLSTLPPNQSAYSSVSSSSTSSSASVLSPTLQSLPECGTLTSSSLDLVSQPTHLHTPRSLPMDIEPSSHMLPSPVYNPQALLSAEPINSTRIFHPPPSAPPHINSPVQPSTMQPSTRYSQSLSDVPSRPTLTSPIAGPASSSSSLSAPPPMNKVAEFAAQMICYLWFAEPSSLQRNSTSHVSPFDPTSDPQQPFSGSVSISTAQLVPKSEFVMFIHNLLNTTQLSHSVVLLALFYIHRLKCLNPIKPNAKSEYRIGVVSLMLANKMLDDHTYTAKTWSDVSRLPLPSLNDGEIEFLQGLNFELHVNIRDFSAWFRLLHGMVNLKDRHTAAALASGPRTRWFKKMRVVSGEGLDVLEGLVSPIRNSTLMKEEEEKIAKEKVAPPTPTRPVHASRLATSTGPCHEPPAPQPSHPYNLRRSARNVSQMAPARPVHSLRQSTISPSVGSSPVHYAPPSWGPSPLVPGNYTRPVLPLPNVTPLQANGYPRSNTNSKARTVSSYHHCDSARTSASSTSHKRNLSDTFDSQESVSSQSRKRMAPVTPGLCSAHVSSVNSIKPPSMTGHTRLPPMALSKTSSPSGSTSQGLPRFVQVSSQEPSLCPQINYLGNAIVPLQPAPPHQGTELYFHSLAAGQRGPGQLVRQDVHSALLDSQVYVFGSQPWRQGTPMDSAPIAKPAGPGGLRLMQVARGCISQQSSPCHHDRTWSPPTSAGFYQTGIQTQNPAVEKANILVHSNKLLSQTSHPSSSIVLPPINPHQRRSFLAPMSQSSPPMPTDTSPQQMFSGQFSTHPSHSTRPASNQVSPIHHSSASGYPTSLCIVEPPPTYSNFSNAGMPGVIWHPQPGISSSSSVSPSYLVQPPRTQPPLLRVPNVPLHVESGRLPSHHLHPHQHPRHSQGSSQANARVLSRTKSAVTNSRTCSNGLPSEPKYAFHNGI